MKNIIIAILVAVVLVFAFLFFSQKKNNLSYEPWPETEPATVKPTTTNNQPANQSKLSNATVVAEWKSLTSNELLAIANEEDMYLEKDFGVKLSETIDLTGDGIDEGIFTGNGGNNGASFIMIKGNDGKSFVAKQKNKDGTINQVYLVEIGRVMFSEGFELVPNEYGFYTISKINNEESGNFSCKPNGVNAYSWNTSIKMFEWNQVMTTKYTTQVCS